MIKGKIIAIGIAIIIAIAVGVALATSSQPVQSGPEATKATEGRHLEVTLEEKLGASDRP